MALKNIFLDTNVYLSFYSFTNEDLEELKKLSVVLNKKIKLFTTIQVMNEFKRNRENKVSDALLHIEKQDLPNKYPQICRSYPEYKELRDYSKKYSIDLPPDLAAPGLRILYSEKPYVSTAVLTKNTVKATPIFVSLKSQT